jgi:hypothetical protein
LTFVTPTTQSETVYWAKYSTDANGSGYTIDIISGTITAYLDDPLILRPTFSPEAADQDFTFSIADASGNALTTVTGTKTTVTSTMSDTWNVLSLTSTVAQNAVVTIASASAPSVKQTVSVSFVARPNLSDYLNANAYIYRDSDTYVLKDELSFANVTEASGVYSGTLTLTDKVAGTNEVCRFVSAYDSTSMIYTLTATKTSGKLDAVAKVTIDRYFKAVVIDADTNSVDCALKTPESLSVGTFVATVDGTAYAIILQFGGSVQIRNADFTKFTEFSWTINPTISANGYAINFTTTK